MSGWKRGKVSAKDTFVISKKKFRNFILGSASIIFVLIVSTMILSFNVYFLNIENKKIKEESNLLVEGSSYTSNELTKEIEKLKTKNKELIFENKKLVKENNESSESYVSLNESFLLQQREKKELEIKNRELNSEYQKYIHHHNITCEHD